METKYAGLLKKALDLGDQEAKILSAAKIVFDSRAFLKCRFGSNRWGKYWTSPPQTNLSPQMFKSPFHYLLSLTPISFYSLSTGWRSRVETVELQFAGIDCN